MSFLAAPHCSISHLKAGWHLICAHGSTPDPCANPTKSSSSNLQADYAAVWQLMMLSGAWHAGTALWETLRPWWRPRWLLGPLLQVGIRRSLLQTWKEGTPPTARTTSHSPHPHPPESLLPRKRRRRLLRCAHNLVIAARDSFSVLNRVSVVVAVSTTNAWTACSAVCQSSCSANIGC